MNSTAVETAVPWGADPGPELVEKMATPGFLTQYRGV